jgi:hypothetical protein
MGFIALFFIKETKTKTEQFGQWCSGPPLFVNHNPSSSISRNRQRSSGAGEEAKASMMWTAPALTF